MNKILKNILLAAKDVALESVSTVVPGSAVLIDGVQKLVDKDDNNNSTAIAEIGTGLITAVGDIDPNLIKDPTLLAKGVAKVNDGITDIKHALK